MIFTASQIKFETKLFGALAVVFFSLIMQLRYQPYVSSNMNLMETISLGASNLTLFSGVLLTYGIGDWLKTVMTLLIIASNMAFILQFIRHIAWIYISKHLRFLMLICPKIIKMSYVFRKGKNFNNFKNINFFFFKQSNKQKMYPMMKSAFIEKFAFSSKYIKNYGG